MVVGLAPLGPYAAAAWSLVHGLAGLYWALGGAGYPFGPVPEDRSTGSVLEPSPAAVVGPIIAALGLAGAVRGVLMARSRPVGGGVTLGYYLRRRGTCGYCARG